jgi:hypothetical protein
VPLPTGKAGNDALIEALEAPSVAKVGEPYTVRIVVQSQRHAEGTIALDREGAPIKRIPVKLSPGANLITTTLRADKPGVQRVRAVLEAQPDSDPRNNLGLALTRVQGKPHVLIAEGGAGARATRLHAPCRRTRLPSRACARVASPTDPKNCSTTTRLCSTTSRDCT